MASFIILPVSLRFNDDARCLACGTAVHQLAAQQVLRQSNRTLLIERSRQQGRYSRVARASATAILMSCVGNPPYITY